MIVARCSQSRLGVLKNTLKTFDKLRTPVEVILKNLEPHLTLLRFLSFINVSANQISTITSPKNYWFLVLSSSSEFGNGVSTWWETEFIQSLYEQFVARLIISELSQLPTFVMATGSFYNLHPAPLSGTTRSCFDINHILDIATQPNQSPFFNQGGRIDDSRCDINQRLCPPEQHCYQNFLTERQMFAAAANLASSWSYTVTNTQRNGNILSSNDPLDNNLLWPSSIITMKQG